MIGEFESLILSCGHSINSYKGFGVCQKCWKKTCGQCLILVDNLLLCPQCFKENMEGPN
jgi:hypothetical protein